MFLWLKTYYNLIFWGVLVITLVGGGWYVKGKFDENTTMKAQISQLQSDQKAVAVLAAQYAALDSKLTLLSQQRIQYFAKTDKGASNAFKTPELTANHLNAVQLCYWNDFGDPEVTDTCLRNAGVPGTSPAPPK
jgi:hypothetical protein